MQELQQLQKLQSNQASLGGPPLDEGHIADPLTEQKRLSSGGVNIDDNRSMMT